MKFHYDENGQAGTGQFWQMESALVLFLIPKRSFQQWRWIFISWSLSNLEKKHGRLYLEHMKNDLNLITMTTNLVISFACNGRHREMCVGGGKREGPGRGEKCFSALFWPFFFLLLTSCNWPLCYSHYNNTYIFNSLSPAVGYNEKETTIDNLNTFTPTQPLLRFTG